MALIPSKSGIPATTNKVVSAPKAQPEPPKVAVEEPKIQPATFSPKASKMVNSKKTN
jgi:hypothetical protein